MQWPPGRRVDDVASLRALAHPLRQRILARLTFQGSASSTTLAQALGESTGTTSYHLRQLAARGFIVEDTGRGSGRERWWRLATREWSLPAPSQVTDAAAPVAAEVERLLLERDARLVAGYLLQRQRFAEWEEAAVFSHGSLHLTPEELRRFRDEYLALLRRWQRLPEEAPPGSTPIAVLLFAFPWPGE